MARSNTPRRLGELVMLKRMTMEESETESPSSASIASAEFENLKLDFSPGTPAMASVFSISSDDRSDARSSDARSSLSNDSATALLAQTPTSQGSSRFSFHRRSSSHGSVDRQRKKEDSLARWLSSGTVIYKSVGLGLMDLAVGMHLIQLAAEKGIGNHINGF